jgi:23S rRNA (cytosine1962-C5)-methyltransferase
MQEISLKRGKDRRLRQGHLWVFSNEIETSLKEVEPGSLVDVFDANGKFRGRGYVNPHSLIAVRLLTNRTYDIDVHFFKRRLDAALQYRRHIYPGRNTFRLVHGAGDFLPGLIVDKYDDHIVVQANTLGMDRLLPMIVKALDELLAPSVIVARNDSRAREPEDLPCEKRLLKGKPDPDLTVKVGDLRLKVDVLNGQKTGLFLDQAENYRSLSHLGRFDRVLDCFCYSGAWGLHASLYNAREVLGVDSSAFGLEKALENAGLNNLTNCHFSESDVFDELADMDRAKEKFDLIILDPPAFAKSRNNFTQALRAYKQINLRAMRMLNPGGILVTCSCSYRVTREGFLDILHRAASDAGRFFRLLDYRTQARDHTILLSVSETQYLKCVLLQVAQAHGLKSSETSCPYPARKLICERGYRE